VKRAVLIFALIVFVVAAAVAATDYVCRKELQFAACRAQAACAEIQRQLAMGELSANQKMHRCKVALLHHEIDVLRQAVESRPAVIEIEIEKKTARVLDLPEDGDQWCTTLFLDANYEKLPDPKFRAAQVNALKMFNTEPWCLELRQQTHWNVLKTDDPRAVPFFPIVTKTPCLLIQRACGEVIYKESGSELSKGPHGLRRAVHKAMKRHCPDGRCPVAWPTPKPEEPVKEEPIPAVIEKTPEAPKEPEKPAEPAIVAKKEPNAVPAIVGGLLSFLVAVGVRFKMAMQG
jgi:hypothetical protein